MLNNNLIRQLTIKLGNKFGYFQRQPLFGAVLESIYSYDTEGEDISYYWKRGQQLLLGVNPYSCTTLDLCLESKNPGQCNHFRYTGSTS